MSCNRLGIHPGWHLPRRYRLVDFTRQAGLDPAPQGCQFFPDFCGIGGAAHRRTGKEAAWLATLAFIRGLPGPIALQYFYSLVNRDIEDEPVPMAAEFGMGILPWNPLAYGLSSGKHDRETVEATPPRPGEIPNETTKE